MKLFRCSRTLIAIAILAIPVQRARAYGPDGHHIVGAIADERLANTPAGKKIAQMLDGMTLREAAQVPDTIKGWDSHGVDDPRMAEILFIASADRGAAARILDSQSADARHQFADAVASLVSLH